MNLDQAPPPKDKTHGYKPDPLGSGNLRWWNGVKWGQQIKPPPKRGGKMPPWLIVTLTIVGVLVVIGAVAGDEDEPEKKTKRPAKLVVSPPPTGQFQPNPSNPRPANRTVEIHDALSDVPDTVQTVKVDDVIVAGPHALVYLKTPEGGFEGASTRDMNEQVAAALRDIYTETSQKGPVTIGFRGGMVDAKTGADLPDYVTAAYEITAREGRQVNWADSDLVRHGIDWSLYRTKLDPAIKQDD